MARVALLWLELAKLDSVVLAVVGWLTGVGIFVEHDNKCSPNTR